MVIEIELLVKLVVSLFFGMFIGIDRELKHKPLGLRTCMVICVASCLVTIVSIRSFHTFATPTFSAMDPMRLAAQIVSGVGFLGAGVILRRSNDVISGLTSAAMIWAASGLGIAVGAGFYFPATIAMSLLIISVNTLPFLIKKIGPSALRDRDLFIRILLEPNEKMTEILKSIESTGIDENERKGIKIRTIKLKDLENGNRQLNLTVSAPDKYYTTDLYYYLKKIDSVLSVDIEYL